MALLYPYAKWNPTSTKDWGEMGKMLDPLSGVLLHITDGVKGKLGELKYLTDHYDFANNSEHFAIAKSGEIWQFVDLEWSAKALGGGLRDTKWISVENFALPDENSQQLHQSRVRPRFSSQQFWWGMGIPKLTINKTQVVERGSTQS